MLFRWKLETPASNLPREPLGLAISAGLRYVAMSPNIEKVLLRDPLLPAELLPSRWHGTAAYQLCRNLYLSVFDAADEYMTQAMETADGPLPPPAPEFFARFGGLRKMEQKT